MSEQSQCSEYDSKNHACRSGHVRLHPICRGIAHGCESCGKGNVPMCMFDDQPPHLIRDDGLPLSYPDSMHNTLTEPEVGEA